MDIRVGLSNLGNNTGTIGYVTGNNFQLDLVAGSNITLSQSINLNSASITVIGGGGGPGGGGTNTFSVSGFSSVTGPSLQLVFSGGNNITLAQSTDTSGMTLGISGANQSVQPAVQSLNASIGSISISSSNIITVSNNAGTIYIQATTSQSVQPIGTNTFNPSISVHHVSNVLGTIEDLQAEKLQIEHLGTHTDPNVAKRWSDIATELQNRAQ